MKAKFRGTDSIQKEIGNIWQWAGDVAPSWNTYQDALTVVGTFLVKECDLVQALAVVDGYRDAQTARTRAAWSA